MRRVLGPRCAEVVVLAETRGAEGRPYAPVTIDPSGGRHAGLVIVDGEVRRSRWLDHGKAEPYGGSDMSGPL